MTIFDYKALTPSGEQLEGQMDASSRAETAEGVTHTPSNERASAARR